MAGVECTGILVPGCPSGQVTLHWARVVCEVLKYWAGGVGQSDHRYLYLQALKQLITLKAVEGINSADSLQGHIGTVLQLLIAQCDAEEEGVRSMVSECLGRLALIAPATVLPRLQASLCPSLLLLFIATGSRRLRPSSFLSRIAAFVYVSVAYCQVRLIASVFHHHLPPRITATVPCILGSPNRPLHPCKASIQLFPSTPLAARQWCPLAARPCGTSWQHVRAVPAGRISSAG